LPICLDEITNHPAESVSQLVYQVTQGREKLRMKTDASGIRENSGAWCTNVITSGNASLIDKLFSIKASPEGELMRFLEIRPTIKLEGAIALSDVMDGIDKNYGGIGALYTYYLTTQLPRVLELLQTVKTRLRRYAVLGEAQRFWLAMLTVNITGGLIARDLGFINYDIQALEQWAIAFISSHQNTLSTRKLLPENVFHDIVAKYSTATIIGTISNIPQLPKQAPLVRLDLTDQTLSISLALLTDEAHKRQVPLDDLTTRLFCDTYQYKGSGMINLARGIPTHIIQPLVMRCAVFAIDPSLMSVPTTVPDNVVDLNKRRN